MSCACGVGKRVGCSVWWDAAEGREGASADGLGTFGVVCGCGWVWRPCVRVGLKTGKARDKNKQKFIGTRGQHNTAATRNEEKEVTPRNSPFENQPKKESDRDR